MLLLRKEKRKTLNYYKQFQKGQDGLLFSKKGFVFLERVVGNKLVMLVNYCLF